LFAGCAGDLGPSVRTEDVTPLVYVDLRQSTEELAITDRPT